MTATLGDSNALEVARAEGSSVRLRAGQDFYPQRFSASGHARGNVVFAGFGITSKRLGWDDYRGDVAGKIVLLLDHELVHQTSWTIANSNTRAKSSGQN